MCAGANKISSRENLLCEALPEPLLFLCPGLCRGGDDPLRQCSFRWMALFLLFFHMICGQSVAGRGHHAVPVFVCVCLLKYMCVCVCVSECVHMCVFSW